MSTDRTGKGVLAASVAAVLCGGLVIAGTIVAASAAESAAVLSSGAGSAAPTHPAADEAGSAKAGQADPEPATPEPARQGAPTATKAPEVDPAWVRRVAREAGIGERALTAYANAASRMSVEQPSCGLGWNTLAAIGFVESEHGTMGGSVVTKSGLVNPAIVGIALDGATTDAVPDTDGGALDGDLVWDRAVGPMQFLPFTWKAWGARAHGGGVPDPQNLDDAAYSAGRYLCSHGDLRDSATWITAIAAYNNATGYNQRVAEAATSYLKF